MSLNVQQFGSFAPHLTSPMASPMGTLSTFGKPDIKPIMPIAGTKKKKVK
jgi:hypothetical protein